MPNSSEHNTPKKRNGQHNELPLLTEYDTLYNRMEEQRKTSTLTHTRHTQKRTLYRSSQKKGPYTGPLKKKGPYTGPLKKKGPYTGPLKKKGPYTGPLKKISTPRGLILWIRWGSESAHSTHSTHSTHSAHSAHSAHSSSCSSTCTSIGFFWLISDQGFGGQQE